MAGKYTQKQPIVTDVPTKPAHGSIWNGLLYEGGEPVQKTTGMHQAAEKGVLLAIVRLRDEGHPIEWRDENDDTPLHLAAKNGQFQAISFLLNFGHSLNPVNKDWKSPLDLARETNNAGLILFCESMGMTSGQDLKAAATQKIQDEIAGKAAEKLDAAEQETGTHIERAQKAYDQVAKDLAAELEAAHQAFLRKAAKIEARQKDARGALDKEKEAAERYLGAIKTQADEMTARLNKPENTKILEDEVRKRLRDAPPKHSVGYTPIAKPGK